MTKFLPHRIFLMSALTVTIGRTDERPWFGPFDAVLDTSADMTIVPMSYARRVKAKSLGQARLRGLWGEAHTVILFLVDLQIEDWRLPGVQVAGDETMQAIYLGRNVLNKLPLFVDGPREQSEVLDDATVKRLRARREAQEPR